MKLFKLYAFVLISTLALHASGPAGPGGADVAADDLIPETWNCHEYFTRKSEVNPGFRTEDEPSGTGGMTLLFNCSCLEEAEFLLAAGVDPTAVTPQGKNALFGQNSLSIVRALVERGANPHQRHVYGIGLVETPIHRTSSLDVTKFYVEECGVDPTTGVHLQIPGCEETLPTYSILGGADASIERLRYLFDCGADPNEILYCSNGESGDKEGYVPHMSAATSFFWAFCAWSREHHQNFIPAERAATYPPATAVTGYVDVFAEFGADFSARAKYGRTVAHYACTQHAIRALAKHGAPLDEVDEMGKTPLLSFAESWRQNKEIVESGGLPLITGAVEMYKEAAEALVLLGARTEVGGWRLEDTGMFTEEEFADVIKRRDALAVIREFVRRTRA